MPKLDPTIAELENARVVRLKPHQQQVLSAFIYLINKNGVFPSGYQVVEHTGLTEHQVDKAITVLLKKGLIKKNRH